MIKHLTWGIKIHTLLTKHRFIHHIIQPDQYVEFLERCIESKSLKTVKTIHQHILKNVHYHDEGVNWSIVLEKLGRMYGICGRLDHAHKVFDEMSDASVMFWNLLIRGYAWNGPFEEAVELYRKMVRCGVVTNKYTYPFVLKACSSLCDVETGEVIHGHSLRHGFEDDIYVATALVDLYAKCGKLAQAEKVFYKMECRDIVAWNAMIAGFSSCGFYDDVVKLIVGMQKAGIKPNLSTIVTISEEDSKNGPGSGLSKWVPHLYVNNSDYVCCYYADPSGAGGEGEKGGKENVGPVSNVAAKLFVLSKGNQKFLDAHRLEQWWADDLELQTVINNSKLISRQLKSLDQLPSSQQSALKPR